MTKAILVSKQMVTESYIEHLTNYEEPQTIEELEFIRSLKRDSEHLLIYIARVTSDNPKNPEYKKLLRSCLRNKHVSVFEHVNLTMELETDIATSKQLIRHRSFTWQEFSRRYSAKEVEFVPIEARKQDLKNRQNTTEDLDISDKTWFTVQKEMIEMKAKAAYEEGVSKGIGKECLRYFLPQSLKTKLYMTGNIRSFVHYIDVRTQKSTQKEHRLLAEAIKKEFARHFPVTANALWGEENV
jgi:thymidylate synthase (FAD)